MSSNKGFQGRNEGFGPKYEKSGDFSDFTNFFTISDRFHGSFRNANTFMNSKRFESVSKNALRLNRSVFNFQDHLIRNVLEEH